LLVEIFAFLFTDIEGSTGLLRRLGEESYTDVLADHRSIIRSGFAAHDGEEVDTQGDAFFAVFSRHGAARRRGPRFALGQCAQPDPSVAT
jgi:class 3 adenylate cyclase